MENNCKDCSVFIFKKRGNKPYVYCHFIGMFVNAGFPCCKHYNKQNGLDGRGLD